MYGRTDPSHNEQMKMFFLSVCEAVSMTTGLRISEESSSVLCDERNTAGHHTLTASITISALKLTH